MLKMKNVMVKFEGTIKKYSFKSDLEVAVGNTVVCDTATGLTVGKVVAINDDLSKANAWIVDVVDMERHTKRVEREQKLKEIREKMDKRISALKEEAIYQMFAQQDEEMKTLLEEYKSI